ncbi:histamine N-methyltransferase B-like [Lytechinus variegatus]|uniref:histamine N-methyltransferase B-like n=1 Tax=Lytechinus variegatus TaxID=7654 RepID=UPI001BB11E74|nr:histamine N-methyltransferase B-like [Lytechinus variegatus]
METANLKSLMHDPDYYTKSFHAYAKNSKKFAVLERWGENTFPQLIGDRLANTFPQETNINMLGIGSGSGEMDSSMAASVKARFESVRNVVLEPAAKQLEMYRSLVESKKTDLGGIEFDLRQCGMDEYRAQVGDQPSKYHFISAIHSLYYAKDHKDTIRYLYDCLEEGGILLIIVVSDVSGFWRLWDRFTRFQDSVSRYLCTTHIRDSLSSLGITFDESRQASRVDITSCFQEGSDDGELIVDFLSHTVDLRGSASPELYREVVNYMGSEKCAERKEDGSILFNNDWDATIIQKPLSK